LTGERGGSATEWNLGRLWVGLVMECSYHLRKPGGEMEGLPLRLVSEAALGWSAAI